jgi:hypothetical protein
MQARIAPNHQWITKPTGVYIYIYIVRERERERERACEKEIYVASLFFKSVVKMSTSFVKWLFPYFPKTDILIFRKKQTFRLEKNSFLILLPIHSSLPYQIIRLPYKSLFHFLTNPHLCQQKILKKEDFLREINLSFHSSLPSPICSWRRSHLTRYIIAQPRIWKMKSCVNKKLSMISCS